MRLDTTDECCNLQSVLHSLLVTSVVSSANRTRFRWVANAAALTAWSARSGVAVSFLLVSFDHQSSSWADAQAESGHVLHVVDPTPLEHRFHPKQYLQYMYVKRLAMESRARYMWSLDEDLELRAEGHEFQIDRFFERFACGFPEGPPLIAQPLISPGTQAFHVFNYHEFLRRVGKAQMPFITEVIYVEYQAPLVDARFWLFLMDVIGDTIAALEDSYRTDWGMDAVWCGAARHYAASRLAGQAMSRRACAVVPIPLRHHSSNTIAHSAQLVNGGYAIRNWVSHNLVPFLRARGEHVNHTWENDWWVFREYKVQSSPTAREKLYHRLLSNNSSRYELARTPCHLSV